MARILADGPAEPLATAVDHSVHAWDRTASDLLERGPIDDLDGPVTA